MLLLANQTDFWDRFKLVNIIRAEFEQTFDVYLKLGLCLGLIKFNRVEAEQGDTQLDSDRLLP